MAEFELRTRTVFVSTGNYTRQRFVHDSVLRADRIISEPGQPRPEPEYKAPTGVKLGEYCRERGELCEVYHRTEQDGRSQLVFIPNAPQCPYTPPGGGTTTTPPTNDPVAPAGGKLLTRLPRPVAGDRFSYTDRYYVPSTRLVQAVVSGRTFDLEPASYSRPVTEILDRWCVDTGAAPFTEIRVTHNGAGGVTQTPVDNVAACFAPACTIGVSVTANDGVNALGLGAVELTATGAPSNQVRYALGDAANPGQATGLFPELRAGRYRGFARQDGGQGCVAQVDFQVQATYGLRYVVAFKDWKNRSCRLELRVRAYTGAAEELESLPNTVDIDYPQDGGAHFVNTVLKGSSADLNLYASYSGQLQDLYSADERYVQVRVLRGEAVAWVGWLLPEQYSVAHLAPLNEFQVRASDGLLTLAGLPFADPAGNPLFGEWTGLRVLLHCLNRIGLELPLYLRDELYPVGGSNEVSPWAQFKVNVQAYADLDCAQVLEELLSARGCRLYQDATDTGACWVVERLADLTVEPMAYAVYSADGEMQPEPVVWDRLLTIQPPNLADELGPSWRNNDQRQELVPAVSLVRVKAKPGALVNLLARHTRFAPEDFTAAGSLRYWSGTAPTVRVAPVGDELPAVAMQGPPVGTSTVALPLYIQSPPTERVPLFSREATAVLLVKAKATLRASQGIPAGLTEDELPTLRVAVQAGPDWVSNGGNTSSTQVLTQPWRFDALDKEVEVSLAVGAQGLDNRPVAVRFYQIVTAVNPGRPAQPRYTLELRDVRLQWSSGEGAEDFFDTVEAETQAQFTRPDDGLSLLHTDTPTARLNGTLLGPDGQPTQFWYTATETDRPLLAYLVRDRLVFQEKPSPTLSGTLYGWLSPGTLLTDPAEADPGVYVLTSVLRDEQAGRSTITAVRNRRLLAPAAEEPDVPAFALLMEDGSPTETEDDFYLLAEDGQ